jgi:hypothetical protein
LPRDRYRAAVERAIPAAVALTPFEPRSSSLTPNSSSSSTTWWLREGCAMNNASAALDRLPNSTILTK